MQTISPANNQLFCKPSEKERKTASGIILSEEAAHKPHTAVVINSSSKDFSKDDIIVYKAYAATEIKLNNEDYIIIDAEDALGKVLEIKE